MSLWRDPLDVLALFAAGKVRPIVEAHPRGRVNEARGRLQAGNVRCRAVVALK
jgi:D-arabinose 1-dehydrogenase-like Zn-dependent alcohol dehydrogenase